MYLSMQTITTIDIVSLVLSLVALSVTVIGFFASLYFFKEGVVLQRLASDALVKLEEKTQFIQTQVGGMFERTLDAAISRRELVVDSFAELHEDLERTRKGIVEESIKQIGAASEQERARFTQIVDEQIEGLRKTVETTQESVESLASDELQIPTSSLMRVVVSLLAKEEGELSATEIAERLKKDYLSVIDALRKLTDLGLLTAEGQGRRTLYRINPGSPTLRAPRVLGDYEESIPIR
jgi:DNA-binding transcriptional ArsR family regulator